MIQPYFFDEGGSLYFLYDALDWDITPPELMDTTKLTGVTATAVNVANGAAVTITDAPTYVAALKAYRGRIAPGALQDMQMVRIFLTGVVAPGVPQNWAPKRRIDVPIDASRKPATLEFG